MELRRICYELGIALLEDYRTDITLKHRHYYFMAIEASGYNTTHDGSEYYEVSWVQGHIYVIDVFLRFMASHGYTLQRTKKKLTYADLNETLEKYDEDMLKDWKDFVAQREAEGKTGNDRFPSINELR